MIDLNAIVRETLRKEYGTPDFDTIATAMETCIREAHEARAAEDDEALPAYAEKFATLVAKFSLLPNVTTEECKLRLGPIHTQLERHPDFHTQVKEALADKLRRLQEFRLDLDKAWSRCCRAGR